MKQGVTLLMLLACGLLGAMELGTREAYQPIIDRKPFGEIGKMEEPSTSTLTTEEEQKKKEEIAQKFRMCGITDMPDGSRKIAFIDETTGTMEHYLLAVGETQNGFTLLAADYDREHATLKKDGVTLTLGLGQGLIDAPPEVEKTAMVAPAVKKIEVRSAALPPPAAGRGSAKARLLKRQAAKAEAEQAKAEAMQAQVTQQLEQKRRREEIERIKKGLPPTQPITLTPEEDAELEAAGVFNQSQEAAPTETPQDGEALLINIQPETIE